MRAITKGQEPPSLTAHRRASHGDYGNYRDKDTLRETLAFEQRGYAATAWDAYDPVRTK